ncbi:endonuclease/exonuclease/phosphatase family protein [Oceanitalea stevensii]|uniref:Endonuclease/exonuclease/phosphatase family protein n=1 Tax=Oceanitalea stevensii TaxID=2763072 RepID=A0ABR8Z0V3_9MICO|nr:endonuclease/exonuclease/phosphatase family protein [Oceanitalea stevensii]MBD8061923.1 endonuclease/exonuclease/phosphatase family protein [Oceanitalea stevensii]
MLKLLGWVLTLALAAAAVLTLDPARLGLSTSIPVTQAIAMRPYLVAGFVVLGGVLLLGVLLAALLGRRWPRRTALAVVLLAVGAGHAGVLWHRGLGDEPLPAAQDGAVTVLTLNTLGGGSSPEQVADAADDAGADVLVLPETSADSARAIAEGLTERSGTAFQLFVERTGAWDSSSTALLVSEELGEYAQAPAPTTAHGAVRAEPVDGSGPVLVGVHPMSPHAPGPAMERWRTDLEAVTEPCRSEPGVVVAGDFNATLDHAPMRDIGSCVDASAEAGVGGVATWPAHLPRLVGAHIDHVLVDGDVYTVDAAAVLEVGASDHRAVVARISLK